MPLGLPRAAGGNAMATGQIDGPLWTHAGRSLRRIVVVLAALVVPALAMATPASANAPANFLALVNSLRANAGVPAVSANPVIAAVAQKWATQMASTGVLSDNPQLGTEVPSGWTKIGENIGNGSTLPMVFTALTSGSDLANVVDPSYNQTGIGIATDSTGHVWVTEDFGDYPPPVPAAMAFPTGGAVIFSTPQSFSWAEGVGGQYYCLTVGTTQGGTDLFNSGLLPAGQLTASVPALPGSQPLWARIYTYTQGTWLYSDVSFTASGPNMATFAEPTNGATNVNATQPFTWAGVPSAAYYAVTIGTTQGGSNLANSGPVPAAQTSFQPPALPSGQTLWARLYSYIGGNWHRHVDISFTVTAASS